MQRAHCRDERAGRGRWHTGRFTLALAPLVRHVIAIEPNATMLDYLRRDAREEGLTNITSLQTSWQDAPGELTADVVICSHVLYPIADIVPFLSKLHAATRRACYIYMRATPFDAITNHLWKHFHGEERCFPPSYIHVLDVLYEMGIYANVEVINLPANLQSLQYSSLDAAVDGMVEQLILPGDEQTRRELQGLLEQWLVEREGVLMPPVEKMVSAIIWWAP